jgi:hypothetical protein
MTKARKHDPAVVWAALLEDIANGASLSGALRRLDPSPSYWWAKECLRRDSELKVLYRQAVEDGADRLAEEMIYRADTPIPKALDGPALSAWVQRLKVQLDVRKWVASKLAPRSYGDKLDFSVTNETISVRAALEAANARVLELTDSSRA